MNTIDERDAGELTKMNQKEEKALTDRPTGKLYEMVRLIFKRYSDFSCFVWTCNTI